MSGTIKGAWTRPDPDRWAVVFPSIPPETATDAQADCIMHIAGDGFSFKIIAADHGVSKQAVAGHADRFKRKVRDLLADHRPAVVTSTAHRHDDGPAGDGVRAAALAAIREFEMIERIMAEPPVPPVHRTRAGRLRAGVDLIGLLAEADLAVRGDKETGEKTEITAGIDTLDLRVPGRRSASLYRDRLNALRIPNAAWRELVLLDDEASRELLEALGMVKEWLGRRVADGRRHGRRRRLPQWSWAGDPDAAARRAAMLAETAKRRQLAESRAALLAIVDARV